MSVEAVPPPVYSFSGDHSPLTSPAPLENLVSARSHASNVEVEQRQAQDVIEDASPSLDSIPYGGEALPSTRRMSTDIPLPQRRPTSSRPAPPVHSPEVRLSAFPDHKFEPFSLRRRLSSRTGKNADDAPKTKKPMLKPTNYVSVFRKTHRRAFSLSRFSASIKGTFAVNPFLDIPSHLLSPLAPGETSRKNMLLKVEDGGIDVDVHLIGEPPRDAGSNAVARTELHLELCGGAQNTFPLFARIHTPTLRRPPLRIALAAKNGFLSLHLPPSFHGLLTLHVGAGDLNNRITLSAALGAHATILSEDSTSRSYFVGALGTGPWEGDRAEGWVEHGKIRVQFSGAGECDLDGLRRVGWELMGL